MRSYHLLNIGAECVLYARYKPIDVLVPKGHPLLDETIGATLKLGLFHKTQPVAFPTVDDFRTNCPS
ncbi:MAG: hypothetical protein CVV27_15110 [Candidatus Melainabacteria bacterium HGW-Melainabacteria-1]|nr:MAG: hypothetical protein CVV27_15110 [Candidatus Melainabacteria bacterium HGW-Melainabacteria-1]